jgi:hypothetical protein
MTMRQVAAGLEAGMLLVGAQLAIRLLGSRTLLRLLGRPGAYIGGRLVNPATWRRARPVARRVDRVADRLPWRAACLSRAVATRAMLRRRGIPCELHLGILGTRPLAAHAWVTAGGAPVQRGQIDGVTALATLR